MSVAAWWDFVHLVGLTWATGDSAALQFGSVEPQRHSLGVLSLILD